LSKNWLLAYNISSQQGFNFDGYSMTAERWQQVEEVLQAKQILPEKNQRRFCRLKFSARRRTGATLTAKNFWASDSPPR